MNLKLRHAWAMLDPDLWAGLIAGSGHVSFSFSHIWTLLCSSSSLFQHYNCLIDPQRLLWLASCIPPSTRMPVLPTNFSGQFRLACIHAVEHFRVLFKIYIILDTAYWYIQNTKCPTPHIPGQKYALCIAVTNLTLSSLVNVLMSPNSLSLKKLLNGLDLICPLKVSYVQRWGLQEVIGSWGLTLSMD